MNFVIQTLLADGSSEMFYPWTEADFYSECRKQAARVVRGEIKCFSAHLT